MLDPLWTSLIVATGPTILVAANWMSRRADKREDWKRQDAVERRAEERSKLAQHNASQLDDNTKKLDEIHSLVNGNLAKALKGRYDATLRELDALNKVVEVKKNLKIRPTKQTLQAIKTAEASLIDIQEQLDKLKQPDES